MHLVVSQKNPTLTILRTSPNLIKYKHVNWFYLFYFINFLSAELFDMLEEKLMEVTEKSSKKFLENLEKEPSTQCMFLQYSENEDSRINDFILKLVSFLSVRFPKNKLSICVMNRSLIDVTSVNEMLFVESFILKHTGSDQDVFDENIFIIKDIKTITEENYNSLITKQIADYKYNCGIIIYDINSIRDCKFLINYLFRSDKLILLNHLGVYFYLAIQNVIDIVSEFNSFIGYLDKCNFKHLSNLEGQSIKLAKSSNIIFDYEIIEVLLKPHSNNFIELITGCQKYSLTRRIRDRNNGRNFIKQTKIDLPLINLVIDLSLYDKTDEETKKVCEMFDNKFDIWRLIEMRFISYNRNYFPNTIRKIICFALIGKPILIDTELYQKILIMEYVRGTYYNFFTFALLSSKELIISLTINESNVITKKFSDAIHFIFNAVSKCIKYSDFQRQFVYFRSEKPWLFNELYCRYGKKIKYIAELSFQETLKLNSRIALLSQKLKSLKIECTPIQFIFRTKLTSFKLFYNNFQLFLNDFFYNLSISDELKKINYDNPAFGLKGVCKNGYSDSSFYLFIIPELYFELLITLFESAESFDERICSRLLKMKGDVPLTILEEIRGIIKDEHFSHVMKRDLFNCIFLTDDIRKKEYIKGLVQKVFFKRVIEFEDDYDIELKINTLFLKTTKIILSEIIFDEIQKAIKELYATKKNMKYIVNLESDGFCLEKEDRSILKIIEEVFPNQVDQFETYY